MKTTLLFLLPVVLLGATGTPDPNAVAAQARRAPAEFAADAMIRLASSQLLDTRARVKLLTEAFHRAAQVQHPIKMRASISRSGSSGAFLERAYQQELDTMSLRLRAVSEMMPLDSAKATKLFLSMARPVVPPVHCEEIVVYDVDGYYEELATIVQARHQNAASLLKNRVGRITSPAEIAPVARLLRQAGLKDADLQFFTNALVSSLRGIAGDDRSFTYYASAAGPAVLDLIGDLKGRNLSALPLAEAYRLYLVNNLTGARCSDGYLIFNGPLTVNLMSGLPTEVLGYNASKFFDERILMAPLKPFTEQETTPKSLQGVADGGHTCQDDQCKHLEELALNLAFGPDNNPLIESQRDTPAWHDALVAALKAIEAWQPGKAQADDVYRNKTWAYNNLYAISHSPYREMVVESWLKYVKQSRATVSDHAQWFLPVSALIGRSALDRSNRKMAELLAAQDDPVIALYLQVEAVVPRGAGKILGLL